MKADSSIISRRVEIQHLVPYLPQLHTFLTTIGPSLAHDDVIQVSEAIAFVLSFMPVEDAAAGLRTFAMPMIQKAHDLTQKQGVPSRAELDVVAREFSSPSPHSFDLLLIIFLLPPRLQQSPSNNSRPSSPSSVPSDPTSQPAVLRHPPRSGPLSTPSSFDSDRNGSSPSRCALSFVEESPSSEQPPFPSSQVCWIGWRDASRSPRSRRTFGLRGRLGVRTREMCRFRVGVR